MTSRLQHPKKDHFTPIEALSAARRETAEIDERIVRQQKRIERALTLGLPADVMRGFLSEMVEARGQLQARADSPHDEQMKAKEPAAPRRNKHLRRKTETDLALRIWMELAIIEQGSSWIVRDLRSALAKSSPTNRAGKTARSTMQNGRARATLSRSIASRMQTQEEVKVGGFQSTVP